MSETINETVTAAVTETVQVDPVEVDPIKVIHTGETLSLSGRSTLEFSIGRHSKDGSLHLRILSSSGGGMVCRDWVAASKIDAAVIGEEAITGKALQVLQMGRSINFGPYCLGICKALGQIRAKEANSRLHQHVPTTTFQQVAMARIGSASGESVPKPGRRKGKGAD